MYEAKIEHSSDGRPARLSRRVGLIGAGAAFVAALAACDEGVGRRRDGNAPGQVKVGEPPNPGAVGGMEYKLGIGDKVKVTVLGQADITGEQEVDAGGKFVVALVGEIKAVDRTLGEVQNEIRGRLSEGLLRDPKVSVQVVAYRPITVLGQVRAPGRYPFSFDMNVRSAVALAGGFERRGSESVIVFRGGKEYNGKPDTPLLPGDTIEIPRKSF